MSLNKYSATEIFQRMMDWEIGQFGQTRIHLPTPEQIAIIESDPFVPSVVIAGAGSGKTETMGARTLWLVANGILRPDQILGLTFTRKAAGELAVRIRGRLRLLHQINLVPSTPNGSPLDLAVTVSTYHSYAGRVLSEHAIRMGIDADADPIGEAAAWQIANQIISNFEETEFALQHSANTIIQNVMNLSGQLGEHDCSTQQLRGYLLPLLEQFEQSSAIKSNETVRVAIETIRERLSILPMVDRLNEYQRGHGLLSFNDQMSLAAELVTKFPDIGDLERAKYHAVLLDEYQDTSYSQVRFLSHLFGGGHPVTAVGDPNQAIYGWRSASPETLDAFPTRFPAKDDLPVPVFKLLTTWRNDQQVLTLANRIIDEISLRQGKAIDVGRLTLRPKAGAGFLKSALLETATDEGKFIADQIAALWNQPERKALPEKERSTFAILVRSRNQIADLEEALRDRGIPIDVVGLGGLIHIPEIADIVALLRTLTFADSGTSLIRLLTGPHISLGPKDLAALGSFARSMVYEANSSRTKSLENALISGELSSMEADDFPIGSIIEALEALDQAPIAHFSPEGLLRLKEFATALKYLRRSIGTSITDAITEVEHFLGLNVEVLVRDGWAQGRRHLDKFMDEAAKFARSGATLSAFLNWLKIAESEEGGLKPSSIEVNHSAVQILTIHHSKGGEWDVVVVPGLAKGNFPNSGKGSDIWTRNSGSLPVALRGDRDQLEDFDFPAANPSATAVAKALDAYDDNWNAKHLEEELRLAYVAFTRAKSHLLVTTSWFRNGNKAVDPSLLFSWVSEVDSQLNPQSPLISAELPDGNNPLKENPKTGVWPRADSWQAEILRTAECVKAATPLSISELLSSEFPEGEIQQSRNRFEYLRDAQALINEITVRGKSSSVFLPSRLSVSTLINLRQNPNELASSIRRPMPNHIDAYARRGTQFHAWVEARFTSPLLLDADALDPFQQLTADEIPLKELQEKWLASEWASRIPVAVEVPFETVLAGTLLRGRIDAVYQENDQFRIVDWKTGRKKGGDDLEVAAIQLAMYRLAYSKLHQIDLSRIGACFYYVGSDETVAPADFLAEKALIAIITAIPQG